MQIDRYADRYGVRYVDRYYFLLLISRKGGRETEKERAKSGKQGQ
jgi:hypothetical protein